MSLSKITTGKVLQQDRRSRPQVRSTPVILTAARDHAMKTKIEHFLQTFQRSAHTLRTYRHALQRFVEIVGEEAELNTETYVRFLSALKDKSPSTQRVYRTAVLKFYTFCKAGNLLELKEATEHYTRKPGRRIVTYARAAIEQFLTYCEKLHITAASLPDPLDRLAALRDRAFVLTLADTGLRISEACSLQRGDVDWLEQRAVLIGKGDKQAVVRFSNRAIEALKLYLHERAQVESNSRLPLAAQPLFARHDIRASKRLRPITPGGMWKAIKARIAEAGLDPHQIRIHDFRHHFVTVVYLARHDLKLAQELARHASITTTNRYAHLGSEAEVAYEEIFNEK